MSRTYSNTPEPRYVERAKEADNAGEVTPEKLNEKIEGSTGIIADLNEAGTKVDIHIDMTGSGNGKVLTSDGSGNVSWQNASGGESPVIHCIQADSQDEESRYILSFWSKKQTAFSSYSEFRTYMNNIGMCPMSGYVLQDGNVMPITLYMTAGEDQVILYYSTEGIGTLELGESTMVDFDDEIIIEPTENSQSNGPSEPTPPAGDPDEDVSGGFE